MNKHFLNSVRCLADKGGGSSHVWDVHDTKDPSDNIIKRFQHPQSINAIKENISGPSFNFRPISKNVVSKEICKLNVKKSTTGTNVRSLKENVDICAKPIADI